MGVKLGKKWLLSVHTLPVTRQKVTGVKLKGRRVMWVGGQADNPADNNRVFIYDVRTRTFSETTPVPAAKQMGPRVSVGVLRDGSVVVAGGDVDGVAGSTSRLSYRYDPDRVWRRTGDLPVPQQWLFMPTIRLRDGRLLVAGGVGTDGAATQTGSQRAFVYDVTLTSTVAVVDPDTGVPTGATATVRGRWDFTRRVAGNVETTLGRGHVFGNAVRLKDGRVFVAGGHTFWVPDFADNSDLSVLATDTDYFDPATGEWTTGAPLPIVGGEDDRIPGSHGGRANGVGLAVLGNGKVIIAGGNSQTDGASYFGTAIGRRSILVMTPAGNPMNSTYETAPHRIPPGTSFGGLLGDGGRNQLLCYPVPGNRVVLAGGQDTEGGDLYDTYVFKYSNRSVTRGPDMAHETTVWAPQHPEWGYPADYKSAVISSQAVCMNNSRLVFGDGTLVHGGGYNGVGDDASGGSRYVEQLTGSSGHHQHGPPSVPIEVGRTAAGRRHRLLDGS